jgi:CubicO group peptidase (beta-lactamase class C family)
MSINNYLKGIIFFHPNNYYISRYQRRLYIKVRNMYLIISKKIRKILWILCYGSLIYNIFVNLDSSFAQDVPLRVSEPVDLVIADLKSYIPNRMYKADVPGLAIALIRNNQVVWTDGFGVANQWTDRPVSSKTVFEVASISKVVTAYTALRLVEAGKLSLDEPVHTYLKKPWLPPSALGDKITLRHLLSHSSGLGDDPLFKNKRIMFQPGTDFLYSGLGAEYVKELIEQVSEKSLERVAREKVFKSLGMSSSSFVNETSVMNYMANGHMRYLLTFVAFLTPFLLFMVVVGIITLILNWLIKGSWRLAWQLKIGVSVLAFMLTELLLYIFIGKPFPNLIWMTILCALVFFTFLFLLYIFIKRIISLIPTLRQKKVLKATITTLWMIISLIIFLTIANSFTGPVPKNNSGEASAIGSLRSTAPDLAAFLLELTNPRYLSKGVASQIDSAQVNISQDFSWGLGIGIQHTIHGDAIWQNAITFAFRGIMVIYPQEGHGVVVLTNSESGLPVAYDIAEKALGGQAKWKFF